MPQRVRRSDGSWATIDTTLRRGGDGRIASVATAVPVTLSGGGTGPLLAAQTSAGGWSMTWPTALPPPSLVGDTAVYADVRPGVDLHVRATATGFGYVLVVRTRAALADPTLRRIPVGVTGPGLRTTADGGVEAVDQAGQAVLTAGGASMWDSSTGESSTVDGVARVAAEQAGVLSSAGGPGDRARSARVGVHVDGHDLVLLPDAATLADPRITLPLYIDPQMATGYSRWSYADSSNSDRNDGIARVGLSPDGSGTYRSFFEFPIGQIAGTRVQAATFQSVLIHSWSCGSTPVSLYWTGGISANGTRTGWSR